MIDPIPWPQAPVRFRERFQVTVPVPGSFAVLKTSAGDGVPGRRFHYWQIIEWHVGCVGSDLHERGTIGVLSGCGWCFLWWPDDGQQQLVRCVEHRDRS